MDIINHAQKFNGKKINKVQELVKDMYERSNDHSLKEELAIIYAYFLPKTKISKSNPLSWLYGAVEKNPARPHLQKVYFNSERREYVASDGHVMLVMPAEVMTSIKEPSKSCYIEKTGETSVITKAYAQYERVIPSNQTRKIWQVLPEELKEDGKLLLIGRDGVWVNHKNYKLALSCPSEVAGVSQEADGSPIRIDFKNGCIALIMPVRQTTKE